MRRISLMTLLVSLVLLSGCAQLPFGSQPRSRIVLQASLPNDQMPTDGDLDHTVQVLSRRLEGLGLSGTSVQRTGVDEILVLVPSDSNIDEILPTLQGRGLLEFIDPEGQVFPEGTAVCTSLDGAEPHGPESFVCERAYRTIADSSSLDQESLLLTNDFSGTPAIAFRLREPGATALRDFTAQNVGRPLSIVLDKQVISSPIIQDELPGEGILTFGSGSVEQQRQEANAVLSQLKYGTLAVTLSVVEIEEAQR